MVLYGAACANARHRAYHLLALAAQREWGLSELPPIARREGGKPYFPSHPQLEFNLSHSGDLVLCALDHAPVGVDIQVIKAMRPGLPARVCSPRELLWLGQGADLWPRFAQLWALKEAYVKYTGAGLTRSISGIQVPLPAPSEDRGTLEGVHFRIYEGQGWRGACCGRHMPPGEIRWISLSQTL